MTTVLPHTALVTPPGQPAAPPIDPTEALLDSDVGTLAEGHAGDLCSILGIVGAATIAINRRNPTVEIMGERIVTGSMYAGGLDTAIQIRDELVDGGKGAEERGNPKSSIGTIAYAATGLIPAVSIAALAGLHRHPSRQEMLGLGLLGLNGAVFGYELVHRVPRIAKGEENLSGYGSLLAAGGGFVVAQHIIRR
jgi:hypothetical protein